MRHTTSSPVRTARPELDRGLNEGIAAGSYGRDSTTLWSVSFRGRSRHVRGAGMQRRDKRMHRLDEGIKMGSLWPKPPSSRRPSSRPPVPTARDMMSTKLVVLRPQQSIIEAVATLARRGVSGALVLGEQRELLGIFSEFDCMRVLAAADYHQEDHVRNQCVADVMTAVAHTVGPDADLYSICDQLVKARVRRLPVLDCEELLGIITRRDVVNAMARCYAQ